MKNLMIFMNPIGKFYGPYEQLCRVQIDTGYMMGWKKKDMLLVTNFDWEYNGVKATVLDGKLYCEHRKRATKVNTIYYIIRHGVMRENCWFHDFDAHQLQHFTGQELRGTDMAMTDYGYSECSNLSSFFFRPAIMDMFNIAVHLMYRLRTGDEKTFNVMIERNLGNFNSRWKKLNCTYSLGRKKDDEYKISLSKAKRPIKVIHMNPREPAIFDGFKKFMSPEHISIFKEHGIT